MARLAMKVIAAIEATMDRYYARVLARLCRWSGRSNYWWSRAAIAGYAAVCTASYVTGLVIDGWKFPVFLAAILYISRKGWTETVKVEQSIDRGRPVQSENLHLAQTLVPWFIAIDLIAFPVAFLIGGNALRRSAMFDVPGSWLFYAALFWMRHVTPPTSTITARVKAWLAAHRPRFPALTPRPIPGFGRS